MDSANPPEQITYFVFAEKPLVLAKAGTTDTLDHDRVVPEGLPDLQSKGWTATPTELSAELFVLMNPDTIPGVSPEIPSRTSPSASVSRTSWRAATASDWGGSLSGRDPQVAAGRFDPMPGKRNRHEHGTVPTGPHDLDVASDFGARTPQSKTAHRSRDGVGKSRP